MSPEAQRIAIAEVCRWSDIKHYPVNNHWWGRNPATGELDLLPDYIHDLDAMRAAEVTLDTLGHWLAYRFHLSRIVRGLVRDPNGYVPGYTRDDGTAHWFQCVSAKPEHRAEAFLLTLELWDDSK